ncbi:hypothetical protein LTR47_003517 [Exophiala xenobiotica]|nr:hypothetical protein LTR92_008007 [Exophiala xenobiotica]KAK5219029.1 hypothetical protein LTR72_008211 [Exophiala xenobiotica]KAK5235332.1 hypothetical protein LTR47_003517 [Exophiala xenobiotica]KAK5259655.1 hypothetical protein LTR40_005553 [Exophiala xenobiotica]KAK5291362.1 hypothetical protein LTR14_005936 [Exophiala xenobiotica]
MVLSRLSLWPTISLATAISFTTSVSASTNSTYPKRGLIYISTSHSSSDDSIFTQSGSPLTWFYNYSPWPTDSLSDAMEFVPMVHGASDAEDDVDTIKSLSGVSHILTFNEPDIGTADGGTNTLPRDAAKAYLDTLAPLRAEPYGLKLSLPATSGSEAGLTWLTKFNTSCYHLNSTHGCEFDFIATHFYGPFPSLTSWLGQIHELYPNKKIWLTEFAIPAADDETTLAMMNETLPYLDGLGYVERYSWFGTFRSDDANEWTGDGVSMLDGSGKLTSVGAEYLGGQQNGFEEGQGQTSAATVVAGFRPAIKYLLVGLVVGMLDTIRPVW